MYLFNGNILQFGSGRAFFPHKDYQTMQGMDAQERPEEFQSI